MICFYKDNIGRINFGSYEVPPTLNEYTTLDSISNKTYGKLNSEQLTRYYSENEHNRLPIYVIEGIEPEPYVPTLADKKADKEQQLNINFGTEVAKGFVYTLNGIEVTFNIDENTTSNILQQKVQLGFDDETLYLAITDRISVQRVFTVEQFLDFGKWYGRNIKNLKILLAGKRNLIHTAETEQQVNDVDITFTE